MDKWSAHLRYEGKNKYLGSFESIDDAKEFIELAREMVHGEFAHNGVVTVA